VPERAASRDASISNELRRRAIAHICTSRASFSASSGAASTGAVDDQGSLSSSRSGGGSSSSGAPSERGEGEGVLSSLVSRVAPVAHAPHARRSADGGTQARDRGATSPHRAQEKHPLGERTARNSALSSGAPDEGDVDKTRRHSAT